MREAFAVELGKPPLHLGSELDPLDHTDIPKLFSANHFEKYYAAHSRTCWTPAPSTSGRKGRRGRKWGKSAEGSWKRCARPRLPRSRNFFRWVERLSLTDVISVIECIYISVALLNGHRAVATFDFANCFTAEVAVSREPVLGNSCRVPQVTRPLNYCHNTAAR